MLTLSWKIYMVTLEAPVISLLMKLSSNSNCFPWDLMWLIQNKCGNEHKILASAKNEVCAIKCGSRLGCLDAAYNIVLDTGVGEWSRKSDWLLF